MVYPLSHGVKLGECSNQSVHARPSLSGSADRGGIAIADINGDGIPDVIISIYGGFAPYNTPAPFLMFLGNGDGTFQAAAPFPSSGNFTGYPLFARSFQLLHVGGQELLGVPDAYPLSNSASAVLTFYATPAAPSGYCGAVTLPAGARGAAGDPASVSVKGDFNNDGNDDVAMLHFHVPILTTVLTKPQAAGPTTSCVTADTRDYVLTTTYPFTQIPSHITTADLNGDGNFDLIIDCCTIFLGKGDGTFTRAADVSAPVPSAVATAVGDFNGDGILDLAMPEQGGDGIMVALGKGDGTFQKPTVVAHTGGENGGGAVPIVAADFNGDGALDIALAMRVGAANRNAVAILFNNRDGTFAKPELLDVGNLGAGFIDTLISTDLNGDGLPDLLATLFPYPFVLGEPITKDAIRVWINAAPAQ